MTQGKHKYLFRIKFLFCLPLTANLKVDIFDPFFKLVVYRIEAVMLYYKFSDRVNEKLTFFFISRNAVEVLFLPF